MELAAGSSVLAMLNSLCCLGLKITWGHILFVTTNNNRTREAYFELLCFVVGGWSFTVNVCSVFFHSDYCDSLVPFKNVEASLQKTGIMDECFLSVSARGTVSSK
jgi:hypothetical protein